VRPDRRIEAGCAAAAALCVLIALLAGIGSVQDAFLTGALVAVTALMLADPLAEDSGLASARVVVATAFALLFTLPAVLITARLAPLAPDVNLAIGSRLGAGLGVFVAAGAAIVAGGRIVRPGTGRLRLDPSVVPAGLVDPDRRRVLAVASVVLLCFAAFTVKVGGPTKYLSSLNDANQLNGGLTYFVWGILAAKFASFAVMAERWRRGLPAGRWAVAGAAIAFLLIAFIGARLLIVVALGELLVLVVYVRGRGRVNGRALAIAAIAVVLVVLGYGELRRWQDLHDGSFAHHLVHKGIPDLPSTYVNNYADGLRVGLIAKNVVPRTARYEYGRELLRLVVHPIPGALRPEIGHSKELDLAFGGGAGKGNALPLPVTGYIQFGWAGAVLFCLVLGLVAGAVDRLLRRSLDLGMALAGIGAGVGAAIVLRGGFVGGVTFMLLDVIGFWVVHRLLYGHRARTATGDLGYSSLRPG